MTAFAMYKTSFGGVEATLILPWDEQNLFKNNQQLIF